MAWREHRCSTRIAALLLTMLLRSHAQPISTNTPVPPLQWINITGLLGGAYPAPALMDAVVGYDENTRTLLIFGGESSAGLPQAETYFLDLNSLTWISQTAQSPDPPGGPPARSAAITGYDEAASYRRGQLVVGGRGSDGSALSDVWEYSYNAGFWTQVNLSPGGPSPRWGAAGGNDRRAPVIQDQFLATPNNSVYLAGGVDGTNVSPLSDVWVLNVTGALSANNADTVEGSWEQLSITTSNVPSKVGAAGAVISQGSQQIVAVGGCTTSNSTNASCADADSYIINPQAQNVQSAKACPAGRTGAAVVPNFLGPNFGAQMLYMLGTVNNSLWDDGGGIEKGEIDILNVDTGAWSRILPSGDPGTAGGTPAYPSPREGAAAVPFTQALVGTERSIGADTLVFGGRDASGNYLSEIWILRAYNGTITQSGQTWAGYGTGQLQSGINADGSGVTVQYMTTCATALSSRSSQTGSVPPPSGTAPGSSPTSTSPSASSSATPRYETSVTHKALSPISVALSFAAVIVFRLLSPSAAMPQLLAHQSGLFYFSVAVGIAAFVLGIVGLATSFTSITSTSSLVARSSSGNILKTSHGQAGIALFVLFYGLVPAVFASLVFYRRTTGGAVSKRNGEVRVRADSNELPEKMNGSRIGSPLRPSVEVVAEDPPPETREHVRSWGGLTAWPGIAGRRSDDSAAESTGASPPSQRSFEVTNRPARTRRASGNSLAAFSDPRAAHTPRNLSDLSWFNRRPSVNVAGESDFALGVLKNHRGQDSGTPATTAIDMMSTSGLMSGTGHSYPTPTPEMPPPFDGSLHALFHASLLALCILSIVELYSRAPKAAFIVFLIGVVAFYLALFVLAWYGKPRVSILSTVVYRLRGGQPSSSSPRGATPVPSRPLSTAGSEIPFPDSRSPYQHHQPPFRTTMSVGVDEYPTSVSHGHGTAEVDDDDEEDEDTRQRRMEEEMSRRDVSIVTVPRRKLFLTNPEESRH